jgi:hypothetical protein
VSVLPTLASASQALAAHRGPVPSTVRQKALEGMDEVIEALQEIISRSERDAPRVSAAKLLAEIAAVRATTSVPRDVVQEKLGQTAAYLREALGESRFATLADGLTRIWDL